MRIVSWNVNGLRAVDRTGQFRRWLDRCGADIVGVQETRARLEQLPRRLQKPKGWTTNLVAADRAGYSGVGLFSKSRPNHIETALGSREHDQEGRLILARFGRLVIANGYFPNGNGRDRDNSRVPFKLRFYRKLFRRLKQERSAGRRVIVLGDFNTAHQEIDLARPKQNRNTSGFLLEERKEIDRWIAAKWVDTFRAFEPGPGHYSWWSQRGDVRKRNIGWRIDYVFACPKAMPFVRGAFIWRHVRGSDHCPVGIDLDPAVGGA